MATSAQQQQNNFIAHCCTSVCARLIRIYIQYTSTFDRVGRSQIDRKWRAIYAFLGNFDAGDRCVCVLHISVQNCRLNAIAQRRICDVYVESTLWTVATYPYAVYGHSLASFNQIVTIAPLIIPTVDALIDPRESNNLPPLAGSQSHRSKSLRMALTWSMFCRDHSSSAVTWNKKKKNSLTNIHKQRINGWLSQTVDSHLSYAFACVFVGLLCELYYES